MFCSVDRTGPVCQSGGVGWHLYLCHGHGCVVVVASDVSAVSYDVVVVVVVAVAAAAERVCGVAVDVAAAVGPCGVVVVAVAAVRACGVAVVVLCYVAVVQRYVAVALLILAQRAVLDSQ